MGLMEILLLVLGIAVFVVSFFVPEKKEEKEERVLSKEQIEELFSEEYEYAKKKMTQIADETVDASVEKAERNLEKVTNEKMLALGEYSDTVMNQISTNHQETVFLYDMLNNGKQDLTNLLTQADQSAQDALNASEEAKSFSENAKHIADEAFNMAEAARLVADEAREHAVVAEQNMILARKYAQGEISAEDLYKISNTGREEEYNSPAPVPAEVEKAPDNVIEYKKAAESRKEQNTKEKETVTVVESDVTLQFEPGEENSLNSNERILELHNMGKSNMAIAKELGLGIGEVKLVIDLFESK